MEKDYLYSIVLRDDIDKDIKCWIEMNSEGYYEDNHFCLFAVSGVSQGTLDELMKLQEKDDVKMYEINKYIGDYSAMDTLVSYIYNKMCE